MLLPIRTNIAARQTPYMNYALIAANVIIFLLSFGPHKVMTPQGVAEQPLREWAQIFMLYPHRPQVWQFVSYAFLHGSLMHILGNMFFLYMFGTNVNDRLGNVAYLAFYLSGAVFAALGHSLLPGAPPVLGASGAVAAVTGAYLVLFPQSIITVLYWFIFIGTIDIPALWFIGFKLIIYDNVIARYTPYVAYDAHLSGYGFGIVSILILLATNLLAGDRLDLWMMIRQWNRRRRYRDTVAAGYDAFSARSPRKKIWAKDISTNQAADQDKQILELRSRIASLITDRNIQAAAELYAKILELEPGHVLPRQYQLDVANQMMSGGQWQESARAYELFLKHYQTYPYIEQVQLMLGVLYSRYLGEREKAIACLTQAKNRLSNEGQRKMCLDELEKLQAS